MVQTVNATRTTPKGALRRGTSQRGFTLIELIVALTLVGLISVALLGGLRFGTRAWESGDAHAERIGETEAVHGLLHRLLTQAYLPNRRLAGGGEDVQQAEIEGDGATDFNGTAEQLQFIAPLPSHVGTGGLYNFRLGPGATKAGEGLVLSWQLYRPEETARFENEERDTRLLLQDIESFEVGYFGILGSEDEPRWSETWDEESRLPLLVILRVTYPEEDPRHWPELLVAPRAAAAPAEVGSTAGFGAGRRPGGDTPQ
jgi:general secretion pathway protein J